MLFHISFYIYSFIYIQKTERKKNENKKHKKKNRMAKRKGKRSDGKRDALKKSKSRNVQDKGTKKKKIYIMAMVFIVAVSMLLSVFYSGSNQDNSGDSSIDGAEDPVFLGYTVAPIGNGSVLVTVENMTQGLLAMPKAACVHFETINEILNMSIDNVSVDVSCEVADPSIRLQYSRKILCGRYMLFKLNGFDEEDMDSVEFVTGSITTNTNRSTATTEEVIGHEFTISPEFTERIRDELDNTLGEYTLLRNYMGRLPMNVMGTDRISVVGNIDNEIETGDYVRIILFGKVIENKDMELIGFEERKIHVGPIFPAVVVDITDVMVRGSIVSNFDFDLIMEKFNLTNISDMHPSLPRIVIDGAVNNVDNANNETSGNGTLTNETLNLLKDMVASNPAANAAVNQDMDENKTIIIFDNSQDLLNLSGLSDSLKLLDNISEVLESRNITYSIGDGSIMFTIPASVGLDYVEYVVNVKDVLNKTAIVDVGITKNGLVSVPREIMAGDKLVLIRDNREFSSGLHIETEIGDEINVSIQTIEFGEQVFPIGAEEV